jgi:hypothetical protein
MRGARRSLAAVPQVFSPGDDARAAMTASGAATRNAVNHESRDDAGNCPNRVVLSLS